MCLLAEIIHTCSHEMVARAAVASMGPYFAEKVGVAACDRGLSIGAFTALVVREFDECSREAERQAILKAMDGSDQPILTGLRLILLPIIEADEAERRTPSQGRAITSRPQSQRHPAPRLNRRWPYCRRTPQCVQSSLAQNCNDPGFSLFGRVVLNRTRDPPALPGRQQ